MLSLNVFNVAQLKYILIVFFTLFVDYVKADTACTDEQCNIQVNFQGKYLEDTCEISINGGGDNETINLPEISTRTLMRDSSEAGSKIFNIALRNCPYGHVIALNFKSGAGGVDNTTGNFYNTEGLNYSRNVQIRLRKEDGSLININDAATMQRYVIPTPGKDVAHNYMVSYYAKGNNAVTAGEVRVVSEVSLSYE